MAKDLPLLYGKKVRLPETAEKRRRASCGTALNSWNTLLCDSRALTLAKILRLLLLGVVLWYVGKALYRSIDMVDWSVVALDPARIVGGLVTVIGATLAGTWTYRRFYGELGERLSWRQAFVLLSVPAAGKYLPGKWFTVAGHVAIAKGYGIVIRMSGASALLLTGMGVLTSTALGLVLIFPDCAEGKWGSLVLGGAAGAAVVLIMCLVSPRLYWRMVNLVLTALKQPKLEAALGTPAMAELLLGSLVQNGLYVCGLSLMVLGSMDLPLRTLPVIVGASCLAGVSGFLAVFAPAGIGVREGVLLGMLTPVVGAGHAGIITLLTRIVQTLVDVLLAAGGAAGLYKAGTRQEP